MPRLGSTIGINDFSVAELSAAMLDGDLIRVDEHFAAIDVPPERAQRAIALKALIPSRLIAERLSAAWVYGVLEDPPARHQLCVSTFRRAYTPRSPRLMVREVVISNHEIRRIGDLPITAPLRTISDIARHNDVFAETERRVVRGLMRLGSLSATDCADALRAMPHLPNKRRAIERIRSVATADPLAVRRATNRPHDLTPQATDLWVTN